MNRAKLWRSGTRRRSAPYSTGDITGGSLIGTPEKHVIDAIDRARTAVIGLGSNLGNPVESVRGAIEALCRRSWLGEARVSSLYRTSPVGFEDQPAFINAVVVGTTEVSALWLLEQLQVLERAGGRREGVVHWGPRVLDLDLLVLGKEEISGPRLQLPHPEMCNRRFVLAPLAELLPSWVHPVSGVEIGALLKEVDDLQIVERIL